MAAATSFAISTYVGQRYGGWLRGGRRYPTRDEAVSTAAFHEDCERHCKATRMTRKVDEVAA